MPDSTADERARNYWRAVAATTHRDSVANSEALAIRGLQRQRESSQDETARERLALSA